MCRLGRSETRMVERGARVDGGTAASVLAHLGGFHRKAQTAVPGGGASEWGDLQRELDYRAPADVGRFPIVIGIPRCRALNEVAGMRPGVTVPACSNERSPLDAETAVT